MEFSGEPERRASPPPSDNPARKLAANIGQVIVGKDDLVLLVIAAMLANGHVLVEDVPGTGKTMLARALARSLDSSFSRVQFTPDLLPSDLTGVSIFNQKSGEFEFRRGPLFAAILLADELNRATPRTQSALLEAMEERTVSVDGKTYDLPAPFFVIATQNPVEQQGVYELPEAQLDRFLIRLTLGYPSRAEERRILEAQRKAHPIHAVRHIASVNDMIRIQEQLREEVAVEPNVADYIVRLVAATREHRDVLLGASPRASLALYRLCQARAWIGGQRFVTPDLVKAMAPAVLCHRLLLKAQSRLGGIQPEAVVKELLASVEVPVRRLAG
ncbi:MAG: MoxR family ATPase [Sumerlaeia bacterium]